VGTWLGVRGHGSELNLVGLILLSRETTMTKPNPESDMAEVTIYLPRAFYEEATDIAKRRGMDLSGLVAWALESTTGAGRVHPSKVIHFALPKAKEKP
jgi:hypothetical protein